MADPRRLRGTAAAGLLGIALAACAGASGTPAPTPAATVTVTPGASAASAVPLPTDTPEPPLSLALPPHRDVRTVSYTVAPAVATDGNGTITVKVRNLSSARVDELVLRWPTALDATLYLAPFAPSTGRLTDALVQPWTRWVVGPGEMGEPDGTTSLGWGPLDAGGTLTIPIVVTRRATGAVAFDLQFLAGEGLLTDDHGGPAETRVSIP